MQGVAAAKTPVTVNAPAAVPFRLEYRHGTADGTFQLLWANPGGPSQPIPAAALRDGWGRFLTNEGYPSDWWLRLTTMGKEMINGKLSANSPMPQPK